MIFKLCSPTDAQTLLRIPYEFLSRFHFTHSAYQVVVDIIGTVWQPRSQAAVNLLIYIHRFFPSHCLPPTVSAPGTPARARSAQLLRLPECLPRENLLPNTLRVQTRGSYPIRPRTMVLFPPNRWFYFICFDQARTATAPQQAVKTAEESSHDER